MLFRSGAIDMRQDAVSTGKRADLFRRQQESRLPRHVTEDDNARLRCQGILEQRDDLVRRSGRPRQLDEVQLNAKAGRFLFPRVASAGVLLIGQQDLVARRQIEAVANGIVALGGIACQGEFVDLAVEKGSQGLARAADIFILGVAKPWKVRLAE